MQTHTISRVYVGNVKIEAEQSFPVVDMAYCFDVSPATVSRIILEWLTQMDARLRSLILWPPWEDLQKTCTMLKRLQISK